MINWFPGHMHKASNELAKLPLVDVIVQIVDSRAISTSSNPELISIFKNKPIITICLKKDLSDIIQDNAYNTTNKKFKQQIIKKLNSLMEAKINSQRKKGVLNCKFNIVVVGLPNVGKSTFINRLMNKNKLIVANKAGVTKNCNLVKIDEMFYAYDTPGIFFKKINNDKDGFILSLIGCINKNIVPVEQTIEWWFNYCKQHYLSQLKNIGNTSSINIFIEDIKQKYKLQSAIDAYWFLYNRILNGKTFKINYEK